MDQDLDMYHEPTDTPSRVRTMNLNEDLGQVSDRLQLQQHRRQIAAVAVVVVVSGGGGGIMVDRGDRRSLDDES